MMRTFFVSLFSALTSNYRQGKSALTKPEFLYLKRFFVKTGTVFVFSTVMLSSVFAVSSVTKAQDTTQGYTWDRFSISAGAFFAGLSSGMILGSKQIGIGLVLNLEDALGLQSSDFVFRGNTSFRFGRRRRNSVGFTYFSFNRTATKDLTSEIEIGDNIYPIGSTISSRFKLKIYKGSYDYSFYLDDRVNLEASIGLFVMPISFSVNSNSASGNTANFTAPLPMLGLNTEFFITPRFVLKQSIHLLYLKYDNFDGRIKDYNFNIEYHIWRNIGIGLGINSYFLNLTMSSESYPMIDLIGDISMEYTGLILYAKFAF